MIVGIHHVAIGVPDFQKGLEFYRDVLGFEVWLILAARLVPGIALILCGRVLFSRGKIDYLSDAQK